MKAGEAFVVAKSRRKTSSANCRRIGSTWTQVGLGLQQHATCNLCQSVLEHGRVLVMPCMHMCKLYNYILRAVAIYTDGAHDPRPPTFILGL